jgi:hypothetical protein
MRLPSTAHTSRPWRIHELTRDFRLEDVWALPTPGGADDFPRLVHAFASADPSRTLPGAARALWAARWKLEELLEDEWAAEVANRTMHGVMHIGWVRDEARGGHRGQMAVLVKPNGLFRAAYMAAIRPFRHLIVYPAAMRQIDRQWRARTGMLKDNGAHAHAAR